MLQHTQKCAVGVYSLLPAYRFFCLSITFSFFSFLDKTKNASTRQIQNWLDHLQFTQPSSRGSPSSHLLASTTSTLPLDLCISEQSAQDEGRSWADANRNFPLRITLLDCSWGEKENRHFLPRRPIIWSLHMSNNIETPLCLNRWQYSRAEHICITGPSLLSLASFVGGALILLLSGRPSLTDPFHWYRCGCPLPPSVSVCSLPLLPSTSFPLARRLAFPLHLFIYLTLLASSLYTSSLLLCPQALTTDSA